MNAQLPLSLQLASTARFSSYVAGPNQEVLDALQHVSVGAGESFVYCWGGKSLGKTHLLQACCHQAAQQGRTVAYLDLFDAVDLAVELVEGWEQYQLVCLDNMQAVAGSLAWETVIFNLYNSIRERAGCLIVSADCAPTQLPISLADLQSRLAWGPGYQLKSMNDDQRLRVLQLRAKQRGCEMPMETGKFLMSRISRELTDLIDLIDQLDKASLVAQRKLTVPFVKQVLSL